MALFPLNRLSRMPLGIATPHSIKGSFSSVSRRPTACGKPRPGLRWKLGGDMRTVVMGAGRSGLAVARFLAAQRRPVVLTDSRPGPDAALELDLAKAGIPGVWG